MTGEPAESGALSEARPDVAERLGSSAGDAITAASAPTTPPPPSPGNPLRRLERYISALAKLGQTYKRSLQNTRRIDEQVATLEVVRQAGRRQQTRLDAVEKRLDYCEARLDELERTTREISDRLHREIESRTAAAAGNTGNEAVKPLAGWTKL